VSQKYHPMFATANGGASASGLRRNADIVPTARWQSSVPDKAGGLTEALTLAAEAKRRGLGIMIGRMIGMSPGIGIAPALLVA
jgi:hypothetical protein